MFQYSKLFRIIFCRAFNYCMFNISCPIYSGFSTLFHLCYIYFVFLNIVLLSIARGNYTCPGRWIEFKASCYLLSKLALPFNAARRICMDFASILAEISTKEENEFVLMRLTRKNNEIAWFGLEKQINSSTFKYLNSVANYEAIGVVEPRISSQTSRCASISLGAHNAVWVSTSCDMKYSYVRETMVSRGKHNNY